MMKFSTINLVSAVAITALAIFCCPNSVTAQQILTETPFNTVSDSFFENHGVNFNFSLPGGGTGPGSRIVGFGPSAMGQNIGFTQGSAGVVPPFGGFDPNASLNTGFSSLNGNGGGFSLGLSLGKGSTRSNVTQAPSVLTQNGFGGSIFDGGNRPFVTGVIPVVGSSGGNVPKYTPVLERDNAITRAIQSGQLKIGGPVPERESRYEGPRNYSNEASSARHGDQSVAAIKARKAQARLAKSARLNQLIADAKALEAQGKYLDARNKYREAIVEAKDRSKKKELRASLNAIRGK